MAQPDGMGRINTAVAATPRTPRARTSPTFEQLLQGDASRWPSCSSPTLGKDHHDHEDYFSHSHHIHSSSNNNKKSVLTKVKEKAKKLRQSLSKKKHDGHDNNATPSWGVTLDDDEDDDDPEYLGAPMYESELAPETYKEKARQHPRADPVVSDKHVLGSTIQQEVEQEKENPISPTNNTITETVTEKLVPAYTAIADATHTIASKIAGQTVSTDTEGECPSKIVGLTVSKDTGGECPRSSGIQNLGRFLETRDQPVTGGGGGGGGGQQTWDKGVSVKQYLMHKLEPGEDDRALSQAITDAISPRKTPSDMGVVEKVKEVVSSLLRNQEYSQSTTVRAANLTSSIPISNNVQPDIEEENHGRVLQAN